MDKKKLIDSLYAIKVENDLHEGEVKSALHSLNALTALLRDDDTKLSSAAYSAIIDVTADACKAVTDYVDALVRIRGELATICGYGRHKEEE